MEVWAFGCLGFFLVLVYSWFILTVAQKEEAAKRPGRATEHPALQVDGVASEDKGFLSGEE